MPYVLKSVNDGYKVCKKSDTSECFSKKPLSKEKARKQEVAIIMSEKKKRWKEVVIVAED